MATVRGSVIGLNLKDWKVIILVQETREVLAADWPADHYIEVGTEVDLQKDGTLIYPVASCSTNKGLEDGARIKMRRMTIKERFEDIASKRKESVEVSSGSNEREIFKTMGLSFDNSPSLEVLGLADFSESEDEDDVGGISIAEYRALSEARLATMTKAAEHKK